MKEPDKDKSSFEPYELHHRCQSLSKQTRKQCGRAATVGKFTCKFHGGSPLQPTGVEHKGYKNGHYATAALPRRLESRLAAAAVDPATLTTNRELAIVTARLSELLEKLTESDNEQKWKDASLAFAEYRAAVEAGEPDGDVARENVTALMHYFQSGQDEWSTWRSIYEVMHVKTKLADSLTRRMSAANQMYSHSEISALLVSILHTIDTLVDDPETRNRINTSIHKTINLSGDDYSQSTS